MTGVSATPVGAGASVNGAIKVLLMMDNDVFTARVQEASVPVAEEVVRGAAPSLTQAAVTEVSRLGRRITL